MDSYQPISFSYFEGMFFFLFSHQVKKTETKKRKNKRIYFVRVSPKHKKNINQPQITEL
jgi:hypothetical protein